MPGTRSPRAPQPSWLSRNWPAIRDVAAFFVGAFLLIHQEVARPHAQPWLVAAGVACLGITGSGAVQRWLLSRLDSEK